ncbi:MAG: RNA polymerase sigma factor [Gemmataceae bacterium]
MDASPLGAVLDHVYRVADRAGDAELLARFLGGDTSAFDAIVRRHGPMVYGVCRRRLGSSPDADDAFQATFLLLVRKASSLRRPDSLGPWLYGVASRTALKAKSLAARRRERPLADVPTTSTDTDLGPTLDAAVAALPAKYRSAVVLCYFEGLPHAEAAKRLGCPPNTVATRLARARDRLRTWLLRRGYGPAAGLVAALLVREVSAAVPSALVRQLARNVAAFAAGSPEAIPATILALTKGVVRAMLADKLKVIALIVAVASPAGLFTFRAAADGDPPREERAAPGAKATVRTANFVVTGPTSELARRFVDEAERQRRNIALLWLGKEMPDWPRPCPLHVSPKVSGAGGNTKLNYDFQGGYEVLSMQVEGETERMLQSVLPHEVAHTVLAHYFRYPVPRWADEGAALQSEDDRDRRMHDRVVRDYLNGRKAVALRRLFALKDYTEVENVMVVYAQSYSVTRFLLTTKDRPTFLRFVGDGMKGDWDAASRTHYGFETVEALEAAWLKDLRGAPASADDPRPSPGIAWAALDSDDRLVLRWPAADGTEVRRTFSLLSVRGYRLRDGKPEEVELRRLADELRTDVPVAVGRAERPTAGLEPTLRVVKDGTLLLLIDRPRSTTGGPVKR